MNIIEFAHGFIGDQQMELYEFLACTMLMLAISVGWVWWYRLDPK